MYLFLLRPADKCAHASGPGNSYRCPSLAIGHWALCIPRGQTGAVCTFACIWVLLYVTGLRAICPRSGMAATAFLLSSMVNHGLLKAACGWSQCLWAQTMWIAGCTVKWSKRFAMHQPPLHHNHYPTPAIQPVLCPFGTAFGLVSPLLYASDPHGGILLLSSLNTLGSGLPLARAQGLIVMW